MTTHQKKDPTQEEALSILQTAKNRLDYLTPNDWMLIVDRSKKATFKRGESLIKQGKKAGMVYLLVRGTAKVEAFPKAFIAQIGPGQICGEMAFLENSIASATVTAEEDIEVRAIECSALSDLFELFPHLGSRFYRSLAVSLSRRLRADWHQAVHTETDLKQFFKHASNRTCRRLSTSAPSGQHGRPKPESRRQGCALS